MHTKILRACMQWVLQDESRCVAADSIAAFSMLSLRSPRRVMYDTDCTSVNFPTLNTWRRLKLHDSILLSIYVFKTRPDPPSGYIRPLLPCAEHGCWRPPASMRSLVLLLLYLQRQDYTYQDGRKTRYIWMATKRSIKCTFIFTTRLVSASIPPSLLL